MFLKQKNMLYYMITDSSHPQGQKNESIINMHQHRRHK